MGSNLQDYDSGEMYGPWAVSYTDYDSGEIQGTVGSIIQDYENDSWFTSESYLTLEIAQQLGVGGTAFCV